MPSRNRRLLAAAAVLAGAGALLLAGCGDSSGYTSSGNRQSGKEHFVAACGSCHVLADAGTKGQIGPNLDDAFRQSLADGMEESTVVQVVRGQIQYPVETPGTGAPGMPGIDTTLPECEEGQTEGCFDDPDQAADDIAVYVASVAGRGAVDEVPAATTGDGGGDDGASVFASSGCGSCHTLAAADASGTVGPNLDDAKPAKALVVDRVTNGRGAMPSFGDQLSEEQIDAVSEYVSANAGQ